MEDTLSDEMRKTMNSEDPPVVIVGAGPAGLTAAISLARLGVETMLVERRPQLSSLPRATAVSLRSMELMRSWGLEDAVRAGGGDVGGRGAGGGGGGGGWRGWRRPPPPGVGGGGLPPAAPPPGEGPPAPPPPAP